MTRDQLASLKDELNHFVSQTRSRLAELSESLVMLRERAGESKREPAAPHANGVDAFSPGQCADATDRLEAIKQRLAEQIKGV